MPYTPQPRLHSLAVPSTHVRLVELGILHMVGLALQPLMCTLLQHSLPVLNTCVAGYSLPHTLPEVILQVLSGQYWSPT